jgi:hypothetical protein
MNGKLPRKIESDLYHVDLPDLRDRAKRLAQQVAPTLAGTWTPRSLF